MSYSTICHRLLAIVLCLSLSVYCQGYGYPVNELLPPTNVHLTRTSSTSVKVTWTAPNIQGIVGYRVYYNTKPESRLPNWSSYNIGLFNSTTIYHLKRDRTYFVLVRARMDGGRYGLLSELQEINLKNAGLVDPPSGVVVSEVTSSSLKLAWQPGNAAPINSYTIQYKRKNDPRHNPEEITDITETAYRVTELNASTVYEIQVLAVDNLGQGRPSNPVEVTTDEPENHDTTVECRSMMDETIQQISTHFEEGGHHMTTLDSDVTKLVNLGVG